MTMDGLEHLFDEDLELDKIDDVNAVPEDPIDGDDNFFEDGQQVIIEDDSVLAELLKLKGIENGKITLLDENNEEQEVSFYELSKEEQLEILNPSEIEDNYGLDDSEVELINHLRSNNLTINQFLENYKQSIIDSVGTSDGESYDIDAYDDQELYMLDLKNKYDLTDDELVKELEKELQDETLFKKKVDVLRTEYKQLEDQYKETQKAEFEKQREEQYNRYAEQMVNVALETPEFYGIELEDDEKNEVLSFLLDLDENGASEFYKTLNDPKKLYEAAWFLRYGKESFDALKNAYESEIAKLRKPDKPKPVVRKNGDDKPKNSIYDLNF